MRDRKLKTIFLVSRIFSEKADSVTFLGFECSINTQNLNIIVRVIFEKIEILNFFLMWTTLNFWGNSKTERTGRRYLQRNARYRIWTRWVSWFRCYFSWRTENFQSIFLVSGIFPGKADSVLLLGFECTINPQNLIKIVSAIFEKFENLNFFLMWTTLNFRGRGKNKKKKGSRYLQENPRYQIWTR